MPLQGERRQPAAARLVLLMRGLRSFAYGLLAVILGVVLADEGFSPAAIGVLITVSLIGDMVGTYVIGLFADSWGRRRTLALLALLMAATGMVFGLVASYPVLLVAAFFGTLGTSASETAPFLVMATWDISSEKAAIRRRECAFTGCRWMCNEDTI
jgi:MFS family permease